MKGLYLGIAGRFGNRAIGECDMKIVLLRCCIIATVSMACELEKDEPHGGTESLIVGDKFALVHSKLGAAKVFADSWKVGFYIQGTCNWTQTKQLEEIKRGIIDAVNIWLAPLKDKVRHDGKNIVNDITVEQVDETKYTIKKIPYSNGRTFEAAKLKQELDGGSHPHDDYVFVAFFYCTAKDVSPSHGGGTADIHPGIHVPMIHIYLPVCDHHDSALASQSASDSSSMTNRSFINKEYDSETYPSPSATPSPSPEPCDDLPEYHESCAASHDFGMSNVPVSKNILLHEIGHVMGLLDTYSGHGKTELREDGSLDIINKEYKDSHFGVHVSEDGKPVTFDENGWPVDEHGNSLPHKHHPDSIMSCEPKDIDDKGFPVLTSDDVAGVQALYNSFEEKGYYED